MSDNENNKPIDKESEAPVNKPEPEQNAPEPTEPQPQEPAVDSAAASSTEEQGKDDPSAAIPEESKPAADAESHKPAEDAEAKHEDPCPPPAEENSKPETNHLESSPPPETTSPLLTSPMLSFRDHPTYSKSFKGSVSMQRLSRVPQRMNRYIPREYTMSTMSLSQLRGTSDVSASYANRIHNELRASSSQMLNQESILSPSALRASYQRSMSRINDAPGSGGSKPSSVTSSDSAATTPADSEHMRSSASTFKVGINSREENKKLFPSNVYTTAKYTLWNFIPYNLYEQFRRFANFVFLLMVIIQLIPGVSPFPLYTTVAPLVFILAVSAIKEAIEDFSRHKLDKRTNSREYRRIELDGSISVIPSSDIVAGDIIMLNDEDPLPCDMLLLSCADQDGLCYVDTAGLDGETNLKEKTAPTLTRMFQQTEEADSLSNLDGYFICENPSKNLDSFRGALYITEQTCVKVLHLDPTVPYTYGNGEHQSMIFTSVDMDNMLLRGSVIKNSGWAAGMVVFTGVNTKLSLNLCDSTFKFSNVEKKLNRYVYVIFGLWLLMAIFSTIVGGICSYSPFITNLGISQANGVVGVIYDFFTFFILYSFCVPMSLYVGLEFSRWMQAFYMKNDLDFYVEKEGCMRVGTSNLNDELGQIDFILSDKTGTITCNEMVYYGFSIGGNLYTRDLEEIRVEDYLHDKVDREIYATFLRALCIVNTVKPIQDGDDIVYRAESADEEALMIGVSRFGWGIINRTKDSVDIEEGPVLNSIEQDLYAGDYDGDEPAYSILYTLAFSSARKRMSVVVQDRDHKIWLFSKGADSKMLSFSPDKALFDGSYNKDALDERQKKLLRTVDHVNALSKDGYRLLLVGARCIPEEEYYRWKEVINKANQSIENRDELIEKAFEKIEKGMLIYGCTAVEDRLQEHVQETIHDLRCAGIRVCVATGDKMETAENIAYNTGIIQKGDPVFHIHCRGSKSTLKKQLDEILTFSSYTPPETSLVLSNIRFIVEENNTTESETSQSTEVNVANPESSPQSAMPKSPEAPVDAGFKQNFRSHWKKNWKTFKNYLRSKFTSKPNPRQRKRQLDAKRGPVKPYSVMIDGESVDMVIHFYKDEFEHILNSCSTIVCCRMSPKQKSKVICFARDTGNITLAIGDGANDISMIRDSNVGIGIYGKEGTGAANSADYVIRRFHHLRTLLFVHGRNCFKGIIQCILMAFWCNMLFNFPQLFYVFCSLGSGQSLYSSTTLTAFVCFAAPFFGSFGFFYTELPKEILKSYPQLYKTLHTGRPLFTTGHYVLVLLSALVCALFAFIIPMSHFAVDDSTLPSGLNLDIWSFGFTVFINVVLSLYVENSMRTARFNTGVICFLALVIVFLLLTPLVILYLMPDELYYSFFYILRSPFLYFQAIFAFGLQYIPHLLVKSIYLSVQPEDWQIVAEYINLKDKKRNACLKFNNFADVEEETEDQTPVHI